MKQIIPFIISIFVWINISYAQVLRHKEILGRPTDNSITVQVFFDDPAEVCIQYGTTSGNYTDQTAWQTFTAEQPSEVIITGLGQDTKYFYRICYRRPGTTPYTARPEYSFHTARPKGKSFSFIVQADPHMDEQSDTAVYRRCLRNQLEDAPDFMIDLGDFLMTDKLRTPSKVIPKDTITYRCHLLRSFYETSCHSVPLFIALGNHEGESGWNLNGTPNNIAVWGTNERKKYFTNPTVNNFYSGDTTNYPFVGQREAYYSWQWGDALFIVIDPYWYTKPKPDSLNGWRWTLGKVQYDWLKSTLENSDSKFKFLFSHQLIGGDPDGRGGVEFANRYEWGGENLNGTNGFAANRPGWYKPIKDLLEENRVTTFFHGHDHFFGKQQKSCLVYQETPQPSHPNFTSANYAKVYGYIQGQILPNSGYIRVTVGPDGVKTEYVRVYLPANETATRHNKDVSATYFIGAKNCYDSLSTGVPMLWNSNYADELIYPNPFEKETKIEFSVSNPERIDLCILDNKGRKVRQLLIGDEVQKGKFQIIWDGKDGLGNELPNGVYYYVLRGEKNDERKGKIILNR